MGELGGNRGSNFEPVNARCLEFCNILYKYNLSLLPLEESLSQGHV